VKTILVFDKYPNMLEAFHRFLAQENYRVITIDKLEEAIGIFKVVKLDLMIIDIGRYSEMEVLKAIRSIKERDSDLPIIITASYTNTLIEERAKTMGAAYFLMKPFDPKDMKDIVRKLIHNKEEVEM